MSKNMLEEIKHCGGDMFCIYIDRYKQYCDKQYYQQPEERRYDTYNTKKFLNFLSLATEIFDFTPDERKQLNRYISSSFQFLNMNNV